MPEITAFGLVGAEAGQGLFGANVLATRSSLEQGGDYDRIIEELGVGSFRYPGGSLTERYFDISNPNANIVEDRDTGELRQFIPLNEALAYAGEEGLSVTIVIPTRDLLSEETDANGDRFAAIDETLLRGFVRDVVTGVHGQAEIEAFELGNEYWGSGQMSSVEYGRLASEMAVIVNDELDILDADVDIIVQSGANFDFGRLSDDYGSGITGIDILDDLNNTYGLELGEDSLYGSGEVNWTDVANRIILSEFDTEEERDAVDQVSVHVYSRGQVNEGQRSFFLNATDEAWTEQIPEIRLAVTEWNSAGQTSLLERNEDYGLHQAHEMLNIMEEFMRFDVETAHVWPLIQNTPNTLSVDDGNADLTPGGAMFDMMQDALPGKTMIDLEDDRESRTEAEDDEVSVHGFWAPDELVFYVAATSEDGSDTIIDFSGMVSDPGRLEITHLGVARGDDIGSNRSDAVVTELDPNSVMEGTNLSVRMGEAEILQVRMFGFTPSRDFQSVISEQSPEDLPDPLVGPFEQAETDEASELPIPTVPFSARTGEWAANDTDETETQEESEEDDGGMDGLADLLATIPLLGLFALFM